MKCNLFLLALSVIFLSFNPAAGQAPAMEWQKYLGGTNRDEAYAVQQISGGGYIVAGVTNSINGDVTYLGAGYQDIWLVELTASGDTVWTKCLGGWDWEYSPAIMQTAGPEGSYILSGGTKSNDRDVSGNHGDIDFWVAKLDAVGKVKWQRCLGGTSTDLASSIRQTTDGGYIVAGYTMSVDHDVTDNHGTGTPDFWVVKLKHDGDIDWKKCLGDIGPEAAFSIQQTRDGGYIVAGKQSVADGVFWGKDNAWIVKLTATGNIEWTKSLGGSGDDVANSIQQTMDGGYVVAGYSSSNDGDVWGHHGSTGFQAKPDFWVVKLQSNGDTTWTRSLGGTGEDVARSVVQTTDGGYMVEGYSYSVNGDVTNTRSGKKDWVVKLDPAGDIVWEHTYGEEDYSDAYSIQQTADGGYILAGGSYNPNRDNSVFGFPEADFWIIKLGPEEPLPVKLISFTAEKQENTTLLQWKTASELHNRGFEIEHSIDASKWTTIGFQTSKAGNNSQALTYIHIHSTPLPGRNYYRLKQIDLDGTFEYSPIRVMTSDRPAAIHIYPNPTVETISITGLRGGETISLTDALGRVLKEKKTGDLRAILSLGGLNDGMYHLHIASANGEAKSFKVLKTGKQ